MPPLRVQPNLLIELAELYPQAASAEILNADGHESACGLFVGVGVRPPDRADQEARPARKSSRNEPIEVEL
jgi:hypothetical protein